MTSEEFIKNHSAFWQQNGFDYQFALFIKYLFDCDLDDIVKYEDEDDVVIEYASGGVDLVQVKHSFLEGQRMTNSDKNIWKTINNWQHYLTIRELENKPTRDIRCILVVNMNPAHEFLTVIDKVRHGEADYADVVDCLNRLKKLDTCKAYAEVLLNEKKDIMKLIAKIEVVRMDNPIGVMFDRFNSKYNLPILADDVLYSIIGKFWEMKQQHKKGVFQFCVKDFISLFQADLQKLTIKPFEPIEDECDRDLPPDFREWLMVQQMASIGVTDNFSISLYLEHYWCYKNSINAYCFASHVMSESLRKKIEQKAIRTWRGIYADANHELLSDAEKMKETNTVKSCGYSCFIQSMKTDVVCDGISIRPNFSSGWMLALSNESLPRVFWRVDWRKEEKS